MSEHKIYKKLIATHDELVGKVAKWLKKHEQNIIVPNCNLVATELFAATLTGEKPDVIGWCSWTSVLIEIKVSRADFLRDQKKRFKSECQLGVGELRYYCCPKDLIKSNDLPKDWGLLYFDNDVGITIEKKASPQEANLKSERTILLSILRREGK